MSDTAASAGARLKAAREQRGMSLEKAAGALHLDPWVVGWLESGDFERIGPPVYGKGFLRRYATLLDLPAEEIVSAYGQGAPVAIREATESIRVAPRLPPVSRAQILGGAASLLLLVALLWFKPWARTWRAAPASSPAVPALADRPPELAPDAPPAAEDSPTVGAHERAPAAAKVVAPPPTGGAHALAAEHVAASAAAAEPPGAPGAGRARLRLSFTSNSWVDVRDAQGKKTFVGNGSANTVRTIAGQAPMHVLLRSGSGVQLEINGHAVAIGPQFFAGDVARFQAGADGVLRREPPRESSAANRPPS